MSLKHGFHVPELPRWNVGDFTARALSLLLTAWYVPKSSAYQVQYTLSWRLLVSSILTGGLGSRPSGPQLERPLV